jgi:putative ABC transport system permease protein
MARPDPDFDEELRTHLDMLEERFRCQGLTPEEARRAAHRQFGRTTQLKEARNDMRRLAALEILWQDARFGARSLRRNPGLTAVIMLTLMLGIGVNTALFSVVYAVLIKPLPYRDPDRLVYIAEHSLTDGVGAGDLLEWRKQARSFETIAAFGAADQTLTGDGDAVNVRVVVISDGLTRTLGVRPAIGRDFVPEEAEPRSGGPPRRVVLLSDHFFRQRFGGDPAAFGQTIILSNTKFLITGVLPPDFRFAPPSAFGPGKEADLIVNWPLDIAKLRGHGPSTDVLARLKPGVKLETARAEIETIRASLTDKYPGKPKRELRMMPFREHIVGSSRLSILVLWAAVAFVLLVACVNVANLLLARAATRQREIAIRAALGAERARLVRQLLTESVMLAVGGGAAGLMVAWWGVRLVVEYGPVGIPRLEDAAINWNVLMFCLALCLGSGLVSGLAPACHMSRSDLRVRAAANPGRSRLQGVLVVAELSLAVLLLCGAGLMLKTLWVARTNTALFDPGHVLAVFVNNRQVPGGTPFYFTDVTSRIEALPGVRAAAGIGCGSVPFQIAGLPAPSQGKELILGMPCVSLHFPAAAGLRLIAGRWFDESDREGARNVTVVNEAAARIYSTLYPSGGSIIGQRIDDRGQPASFPVVIGVISNLRLRPDADPEPQAYRPAAQDPFHGLATLLVRTQSDPMTLAGPIRKIVAGTPGAFMTGPETLEDRVSAAIAPRRFQAALLSTFAALALVLAIVGAYGVLSYAVTERTHEIGVRIALGARRADVLQMVIGRATRLAVAGVAAGLLASAGMTRVMDSLLYGVAPTDLVTHVAVSALLIAVALVAACIPAHRAARVDPIVALRYD